MPAELRDRPEVELLDGRKYPKVSPKRTHGMVQLAMAMILVRCVGDRGDTATEWRCRLEPQIEFVPDVAFVSFERLRPLSEAEREEPPFAPDVAVEIRSPSYRAEYGAQKTAAYLAHGSLLVLDIDPETRIVYAHARGGAPRVFHEKQTFAHENMPSLHFEVAELFARIRAQEQ
ncbi:MAG TPA: Uma2 family endonuclease [Candidatus Dormibacteraeota bacterium]|nr:Uma2 family endonuclease [Candidatus Dormibacteraeota bacterium]